jgi:hypothetical protein
MNHDHMMQTDTPQQASYIQQETYQITYMPQIPTLPQQSNYTIHTSQAATTSRAQFSEAEKSMDSDDNDDWLSWQAVSARGKKRTSPRTTKVPTMKKNRLQETNNHPPQITITNKFEALRHAETEGNIKHERKDTAPPPIFVPGITNIQRLTATIEQVVNRLNYTLKIINSDTIKIMTNKLEYHKAIIKQKKNSLALFRKRTIPTERPPLVGEVSANFCG